MSSRSSRPSPVTHGKRVCWRRVASRDRTWADFVVVVDDDIDPTNLFDVVWAMCTRCDPAEDIEFIQKPGVGRSTLGFRLEPQPTHGRDHGLPAVRAFGGFSSVAEASAELRAKVGAKFRDVLAQLGKPGPVQ